jgi:hypothetical protein
MLGRIVILGAAMLSLAGCANIGTQDPSMASARDRFDHCLRLIDAQRDEHVSMKVLQTECKRLSR